MAILRKENRAVRLKDEDLVYMYLEDGYDQIDEQGNIIKRATGGKLVPLSEHNRTLDEVEALKTKVSELNEEVKVLEAENMRLDKLVKQGQTRTSDKHGQR